MLKRCDRCRLKCTGCDREDDATNISNDNNDHNYLRSGCAQCRRDKRPCTYFDRDQDEHDENERPMRLGKLPRTGSAYSGFQHVLMETGVKPPPMIHAVKGKHRREVWFVGDVSKDVGFDPVVDTQKPLFENILREDVLDKLRRRNDANVVGENVNVKDESLNPFDVSRLALPSSELLNALVHKFSEMAQERGDPLYIFDETALMAVGILVQEYARSLIPTTKDEKLDEKGFSSSTSAYGMYDTDDLYRQALEQLEQIDVSPQQTTRHE